MQKALHLYYEISLMYNMKYAILPSIVVMDGGGGPVVVTAGPESMGFRNRIFGYIAI